MTSPSLTAPYRGALLAAVLAAGLMVAQQVAGKAARDALFLTHFSAAKLPSLMLASAFLSVIVVLTVARSLMRWGPQRVVPAAFGASAVLFALEYASYGAWPAATSVVLYLHISVVGAVLISGFWSVVSESFDPHSAKSAIRRITSAATIGGVAGGLVAERIAAWADAISMLVGLAVLNALCALAVGRVRGAPRISVASTSPETSSPSALEAFTTAPYLRGLAGLAAVVAATSAVIDYTFKAEAAAKLGEADNLMGFFGLFYTVTSIATVLLQFGAGKLALKHLGLGGSVAMLPVSVSMAGIAGLFVPGLAVSAIIRGLDSVMHHSVYRSGYELLYTPLPAHQKRPTKTLIDVGADHLGTAGGSAIVLLLLALVPASSTVPMYAAALVGCAAAVAIAYRLHYGYVQQLASSLQRGVVQLEQSDIIDRTTQRTLTETAASLDREQLLTQIAELRGEHTSPPKADPQLLEDIRILGSGDARAIIDLLVRLPADPRRAAHVIPLLVSDETASPAASHLRQAGEAVTGQLIDALLNPDSPLVLRRRIPPILKSRASERAAAGLVAALQDPSFEVRFRAAHALAAMPQEVVANIVSKEQLLTQVEAELKRPGGVPDDWPPSEVVEPDDELPILDEALRRRIHRTLQLVFMLLSLILDREMLKLSLNALFSGQVELRGTALEYLEHVLPPHLKKLLWPKLGMSTPPPPPEPRPEHELADQLRRSRS